MKKTILLSILAQQQQQTKKTTRQDIIALVSNLVRKHIKDNAEIEGVNLTRDQIGVNLGEVVEVIMKSLISLVAYSKKLGGMVFKVPYDKRNEIDTNNQNRITINQKAKFLDRELTQRVFGA